MTHLTGGATRMTDGGTRRNNILSWQHRKRCCLFFPHISAVDVSNNTKKRKKHKKEKLIYVVFQKHLVMSL